MVQKLADQIRACRARAEQCKDAADFEPDERVREQFVSLAEQWQEVAELSVYRKSGGALTPDHAGGREAAEGLSP